MSKRNRYKLKRGESYIYECDVYPPGQEHAVPEGCSALCLAGARFERCVPWLKSRLEALDAEIERRGIEVPR